MQTKVHKPQGGDEIVVESGGKITVKAGGVLDVDGFTAFAVDGATIEVDGNGALAVKDAGISRDKLADGATIVEHLRTRVTAAEVNAGLELLPAIAGKSYRMVDCMLIAIGGNASGADSVDILGDLGGSRKLLAAAVAGLTQSTVLRAGETNADVLADGASFVANDPNTAITIGHTGSDLATATHIDVLLSYVVE